MARREVKPFLLRIDPQVLAAVQQVADAELRSVNTQIEYLLREALRKRGVTLPPRGPDPADRRVPAPPDPD